MKSRGVSHVINMAEGKAPGSVPPMRRQEEFGIHYKGYKVNDLADKTKNETQLQKLNHVVEAIDEAFSQASCTGLVVNCFAGMSRSASGVLAWLVVKKGMNAEEALRMIRKVRDVRPSNEFLAQIAFLENQRRGLDVSLSNMADMEMDEGRHAIKNRHLLARDE